MSASISVRVSAARAKAQQIAEALSSAPPPAQEPSGVAAALIPLHESILSCIHRGWTVGALAKRISTDIAFSAPTVAKAIDRVVDDALREAISTGAKPAACIKRVLGVNIDTSNAQVRSRLLKRLTRLSTPHSKHRGANNHA